jgi:hypothetical protein
VAEQLLHGTDVVTLWLGLAATVVAVAVALLLPKRFPSILWPVIYSSLIQVYASACFNAAFEKHSEGKTTGSWWAVVGVGLAACVIVVVVTIVVVLALRVFGVEV